ncbi:hypothetical protein QSJ18_07280 [Gordonia sp. ABSL1-1]|uniref:hypothetical protein n=1 Tax=Gordonia sp. ABSL1-1 TaxID=3053923 RepID=UPI002572EAF0|nr:hypothetical protein [Gordonia sp. ABSL1-1]MDL9936540.1 hypothetical protein [Gordonia sp. ABSL1-1]
MRYRSDLERLTTLDAATIERACADPSALPGLITIAADESLEFDIRAEEAEATGDADYAAFCGQESAAWRATVTLLRTMATAASIPAERRSA